MNTTIEWHSVHSIDVNEHHINDDALEDTDGGAVCVAKLVNNASTNTPLPQHQIVQISRKKLSTLSDRLGHKSNF